MKTYRYSTRRRHWTKPEMNYIWERDEGVCVYCGSNGFEVDHVVPVSKGGPSETSNAVLACRWCNHRKSNKFPLDMLIRAFYHLLMKGENIDWLDALWTLQQEDTNKRALREESNLGSLYVEAATADVGHIAGLWRMGDLIGAGREIRGLFYKTNGVQPDLGEVA